MAMCLELWDSSNILFDSTKYSFKYLKVGQTNTKETMQPFLEKDS